MRDPLPVESFGGTYTPAKGRDKAAIGVIASDWAIINATSPGAGLLIIGARDYSRHFKHRVS